MAGISIWTIIGVIILLVALVVLFFPFIFRIEFKIDLLGCNAKIFLFKKLLHEAGKSFKEDSKDGSKNAGADDDDADFAPVYVPPKKKKTVETAAAAEKPAPVKAATPVETAPTAEEPASEVVEATSSAPSKNVEKLAALKAAEEKPIAESVAEPAATAAEPETVAEPAAESSDKKSAEEGAVDDESTAKPEPAADKKPVEEEKSEKNKKLTETEFWTILLTPEFDASAFWAVRKLLSALLNLFRVKFQDCFVEGIRGDYVNMGYGAALNGILKSFPWVGAWDFRMDWTRDHELCAQGQIRASINLCRILGVVVTVLFYGAILAFKFWRRRARVLKTHELPELGWIRRKIVKMLAEED